MKVLEDGSFLDSWESPLLASGLRQSSKLSRNVKSLTVCDGCIGIDGLLWTSPDIAVSTQHASALVIKSDFPFPQIFALEKYVVVCNRTTLLELVGASLVLKATVTGGELWSIASSHDFLYLTNGVVSLVRDPLTGVYSSTSAPVCSTVLNFNGQIICGNIR